MEAARRQGITRRRRQRETHFGWAINARQIASRSQPASKDGFKRVGRCVSSHAAEFGVPWGRKRAFEKPIPACHFGFFCSTHKDVPDRCRCIPDPGHGRFDVRNVNAQLQVGQCKQHGQAQEHGRTTFEHGVVPPMRPGPAVLRRWVRSCDPPGPAARLRPALPARPSGAIQPRLAYPALACAP